MSKVPCGVLVSGGRQEVACLLVLAGQGLLECLPVCWPPFVDRVHDLKEALSALIYTLTAKDIKL